MKYILVNYRFTPTWLKDYTDDYLLIDDSETDEWLKDFPKDKVVKGQIEGNADYTKLSWLVENYDNLPDVFLWGKSNLFKFITPEEFDEVKDNKTFTPLLTKHHRTYGDLAGPICYYHDGIYWERNNSWYVHEMDSKFDTYQQFAQYLVIPSPPFLPFAPGGNYILTPQVVHRYPKSFYDKMRELLPYCQLPAEAHMCERSYYTLWHE